MNFDFELEPEMVNSYIDRRHDDMVAIGAALGASRYDVISNLGHQWKGNAQNFGFPALAEIGRDLEAAAVASDRDRIMALLVRIEAIVRDERQKSMTRVSGIQLL